VVRELVKRLGVRHSRHVKSLPGTPDFVFRTRRKIINVSGCFWHMHTCGRCRIPAVRRPYWVAKLKRNSARDRRNRRALAQLGWQVLTVWECQTTARKRAALERRLRRFLEK
jgi:DNA mismatch endonuclease (patch repair protein)